LFANGQIAVKLIDDRNGRLRASKVFSASAPANSKPSSAIAALDSVFDQIAVDLARWIVQTL